MIYKNGYEIVDKMFEEIGKSKNHEISLESSFQFIDFYKNTKNTCDFSCEMNWRDYFTKTIAF